MLQKAQLFFIENICCNRSEKTFSLLFIAVYASEIMKAFFFFAFVSIITP